MCIPDPSVAQGGNILAPDGARVTHEMGHVLQMELFEQDFLMRNYMLGNSPGWVLELPEHQSAATVEGWATYAGVTAWWDPESPSAVPVDTNVDIESAVLPHTSCSVNAFMPANVARAFWDLDDANDESAPAGGPNDGNDDVTNYPTSSILSDWDGFADGTGNREDREGNWSDDNAVNAKDFAWNAGLNASQTETFIDHNCLTVQDDN